MFLPRFGSISRGKHLKKCGKALNFAPSRGYSCIAVWRCARLWLLTLVALLNSGGMGYWVCHDQIRSGSFWFKVCSEDVSAPWGFDAPAPVSENAALNARSCDCRFVSADVSPPSASAHITALVWGDAPPLPATVLCPRLAQRRACLPSILAPPPKNPLVEAPALRAPPAG